MSEQIKEALMKLDPENDDHWTGEGLPRLDIMKELLGADVTRAAITETSRAFTRKTPVLEVIEDETPEPAAIETQTPQEDPTPDSDQDDEAEVGDLNDDELVEKEFEEAQLELTKAQKRFKEAQADMDVLITARAKVDARMTDAHTIQAFQRAQVKEREKKALRKTRLNELLNG